jgi:UreE urease accessory protein, C-terminal domain
VPDDTAMEQLLSRLGVVWRRRAAIFAPFGGKNWEHGRSALDGHSHAHPHYHRD